MKLQYHFNLWNATLTLKYCCIFIWGVYWYILVYIIYIRYTRVYPWNLITYSIYIGFEALYIIIFINLSCRGGQKKLKKGSVVTYNHDISSFRSFLHSSVLKSSPLIHKEQMIVQQIRRLSPYYCCLVLTLIIYTSTTVYFFTTETSTTKHSSFSFRKIKISNLNLHLNQTSSTAPLIQQPPQKPLTYKHHTAGNNSPKASHILVPTQSPTIEWFAIRRGAGCLRVEKDEIVHYGNCRGNDSSQLWTKINNNRILSKLPLWINFNPFLPSCSTVTLKLEDSKNSWIMVTISILSSITSTFKSASPIFHN